MNNTDKDKDKDDKGIGEVVGDRIKGYGDLIHDIAETDGKNIDKIVDAAMGEVSPTPKVKYDKDDD